MSIEVTCGQCQTSFRVADKNAGKKGKCFKCRAIVRVPELDAPPPPVEDQLGPVGEYDLANEPVAPAPLPAAPAIVRAAPAPAVPVAAYARPAAMDYPRPVYGNRAAQAQAMIARDYWLFWAQIGAGALPILLAVIARIGVPQLAMPAMMLAVMIMAALIIWGNIGILIAAYNADCLLLCFFIPFYTLYFILSNLDELLPYVLRMVGGFVLVIVTMLILRPVMP